MKITTDQVGAAKIDIHVDSSGRFSAEYNDETYAADTRAELLEKLKKVVKAAESERAIPVTLVDVVPAKYTGSEPFDIGRGVIHVKLRGKHAREWNAWLFATEDGKTKFKLSGRTIDKMCRRLTAAEIAEYTRLTSAIDTAQAAFDEWFKTVTITPGQALKLDDEL